MDHTPKHQVAVEVDDGYSSQPSARSVHEVTPLKQTQVSEMSANHVYIGGTLQKQSRYGNHFNFYDLISNMHSLQVDTCGILKFC